MNAVVHGKCDRRHKQSEMTIAESQHTSLLNGGQQAVDCRSKGESCIVLRRNKECSRDSESFSCTLWYKVGSLQIDNLQTLPTI